MLPTPRHRPIHGLLHALPALALSPDGRPDYTLTHPAVLRDLFEHAEDCMRLAQDGMRGIGALLVHAAPETDVGEIPGEVIESLGHLLAELGELAAECMVMSVACRAELSDAPAQAPPARSSAPAPLSQDCAHCDPRRGPA